MSHVHDEKIINCILKKIINIFKHTLKFKRISYSCKKLCIFNASQLIYIYIYFVIFIFDDYPLFMNVIEECIAFWDSDWRDVNERFENQFQ